MKEYSFYEARQNLSKLVNTENLFMITKHSKPAAVCLSFENEKEKKEGISEIFLKKLEKGKEDDRILMLGISALIQRVLNREKEYTKKAISSLGSLGDTAHETKRAKEVFESLLKKYEQTLFLALTGTDIFSEMLKRELKRDIKSKAGVEKNWDFSKILSMYDVDFKEIKELVKSGAILPKGDLLDETETKD